MEVKVGRKQVWQAIISAGRAANVPTMEAVVGRATWYVPEAEVADYIAAGAVSVRPDGGGLCAARNVALNDAFERGMWCLELSDDMTRVQKPVWSKAKGKHIAADLSFDDALRTVVDAMRGTGAKLGGVAPTNNPFFFNPKRPVHTEAFIVGDFIVVAPSEPRFDEEMTLKEDYDFTLQHLKLYGRVARANAVLVTFKHRSNPGGAVAVRTAELEQANIDHLRAKWGDVIADNPKRPNEILLRLS